MMKTNVWIGWGASLVLAGTVWAQDAPPPMEEEGGDIGIQMIVDEETTPSLLDTPTSPADAPSMFPGVSSGQGISVMPELVTKPEPPRLSAFQMTEVKVAINFVWNDLSERRFAVLQIEPEGDFVQLMGLPTGLALDYPLVTERQKLLAQSIFEALTKYGFTPMRADLGEGQYSLQVPIASSKEDAVDAIAVVMKEGFSIAKDANLKLMTGNR